MTESDTPSTSHDSSSDEEKATSSAKKTTTKKKTAKKATTKKTTAKKTTAKKTTTKKTTTKKTAAKKTTTKKTTTKKTTTKKTTPKKTAAREVDTEAEVVEVVDSAPTDQDAGEGSNEVSSESNAENEEGEPRKRRRRRGGRGRTKTEEGGNEATSDDAGDTSAEASEETEAATPAKKKSRSRREWKRPDRAAIEVTPSGPRAPTGSRLMLVDEVPGESSRIAILEEGRLEELFVERAQSSTAVGNIYKARVVNVERAIQAAFVDYGQGMNGFLHVSDLHPRYFPGGDKTEKVGRKTPRRDRPPIEEALKKGQEILVQVLKQGVGTKGPTVTSYLSIPGRLMVMMPGMDRVGVSRKVDDEQRERMRKILDQLDLPEGFGFILRTAGYDKTKSELKRDVAYLRKLWEQLEKRMDNVGAPSELYTEGDLVVRTVRDVVDDSIGSIVINSESGFERASTFLNVIAPRSKPVVRHYDEPVPLFDAFGVESQIEMIQNREVPLKSGGALVIDQTEAMVAIDVNSGRSRGAKDAEANAVSTNREAVDEIARQLRLRDQGGLVVCDLIDMRFSRNRKELEERLAENLSRDRARTTFLPISEFGLVEMTRQRIRPSIRSQYFSPCPHCNSLGEVRNADSVAADAVRRAARLLAVDAVARVEIACGARIASALLAGHRRRIDILERQSEGKIDIRISEQMAGDRFDAYAYDDRNADLDISRLAGIKRPDVESIPTEILHDSQEDEDPGNDGRKRRRRRRRKPAPADVVAIALAGGFEDDLDEDDDTPIESESPSKEGSQDEETGGGGRRRRRRRRRRRGRGGEAAEEIPVPTEPIRVHALAKELGIKSREVLDAVAEKIENLELKGHQSSIPADRILEVKALFAPPLPTEPDPSESQSEDPSEEPNGTSLESNGESAEDSEDGTPAENDGTSEEGPRKKRRRRRRGGRRRRGRGEGSDENPTGSNDADRPSEPRDEERDSPRHDPKPEPAASDESTTLEISEAPPVSEVPIVETATPPKPQKPPKRRSLYGGRFQRVGSTPPQDRD